MIDGVATEDCEGGQVVDLPFPLVGKEVMSLETVLEILREILKGVLM